MEDGYYFVALDSAPEKFLFAKRLNGKWLLIDEGWCDALPVAERVIVYVRAVRQGDEWVRA